MKSPLLLDLTELDPARGMHAPGTPDDPALRSILDSNRTARASVAPPRRPVRPVVIAGAAASVVMVAVGGVVLSQTLGSAPAYASWTAEPRVLTPEETADRAAGCPTAAQEITDGADGPSVTDVPVAAVLAEARGDYTYVVLAGDHAYADCFVTATHDGSPNDVVSSSAVVPGPVTGPAPAGRDVRVLQAGTASWSEGGTGEGAVTSAFGRAGADVAGVTAVLRSGERVEASVGDGWWSLWAPGGAVFDGPARVTFTDGSTASVDLEERERGDIGR
jgi:hypothetical protein